MIPGVLMLTSVLVVIHAWLREWRHEELDRIIDECGKFEAWCDKQLRIDSEIVKDHLRDWRHSNQTLCPPMKILDWDAGEFQGEWEWTPNCPEPHLSAVQKFAEWFIRQPPMYDIPSYQRMGMLNQSRIQRGLPTYFGSAFGTLGSAMGGLFGGI